MKSIETIIQLLELQDPVKSDLKLKCRALTKMIECVAGGLDTNSDNKELFLNINDLKSKILNALKIVNHKDYGGGILLTKDSLFLSLNKFVTKADIPVLYLCEMFSLPYVFEKDYKVMLKYCKEEKSFFYNFLMHEEFRTAVINSTLKLNVISVKNFIEYFDKRSIDINKLKELNYIPVVTDDFTRLFIFKEMDKVEKEYVNE